MVPSRWIPTALNSSRFSRRGSGGDLLGHAVPNHGMSFSAVLEKQVLKILVLFRMAVGPEPSRGPQFVIFFGLLGSFTKCWVRSAYQCDHRKEDGRAEARFYSRDAFDLCSVAPAGL